MRAMCAQNMATSWLVNKMSGLIMGAEDDGKEDTPAPAPAAAAATETAY